MVCVCRTNSCVATVQHCCYNLDTNPCQRLCENTAQSMIHDDAEKHRSFSPRRLVQDVQSTDHLVCLEVVCRSVSYSWFVSDNNMHVNYSSRKVGVYKMAVSMVSVVRCAGKIWNGERKIFAPLALQYHVSTTWWEYIPPCCTMCAEQFGSFTVVWDSKRHLYYH